MTNDSDQRISDALSKLRDATLVPPTDPARERALLAAFDTHWARPRPGIGRWVWTMAAAASIAIAVALDWAVVTHTPRNGGGKPDVVIDMAGFVPWPGSQAGPPFESGELLRVDLPVSALPALGLWPPATADSIVSADIVIGQDGFARAVRLVQ